MKRARPMPLGRRFASSCQAVMIAATKEHTGKTSVSMALLSGLVKRFGIDQVAYMKPVGQKFVEVEDGGIQGLKVDKDVRVAKEHFGLTCRYSHMSPLVLHKGYTRDYLDGRINGDEQRKRVARAFHELKQTHRVIVVEGTGHTGVGSIVGWNNAAIARLLDLQVILVANGGVGAAYDELELNRHMCLAHGVDMCGVILNKVRPDKLEVVDKYLRKALRPWGTPVLACVPYADSLDRPSLMDLEAVFGVKALSGRDHLLTRFSKYELVTTSLRRFMEKLNRTKAAHAHTCFVTHASRNDIILGLMNHASEAERHDPPFRGGLILTGNPPGNVPHSFIIDYMKGAQMPVLNVNMSTTAAMQKIDNFTAKMHADDRSRTDSVIEHYEPHINFDAFLDMGHGHNREVHAAVAAA